MALHQIGWQDEILERLQRRDRLEGAYADIIDCNRRLAAQAALLKQRNANLLKAAAVTPTAARTAGSANGAAAPNETGTDNPVQRAYVASLEGQLASLRDELASLYKTQAQNAQRLVVMTEQLREDQEKHAAERTELIQLRSERVHRDREREESLQLRKEKDRNIEVLQDELAMVRLEMEMIEKKNEALKEDNASLLRRWLEKKAQEAAEMDQMLQSAGASK